MIGFVALPVAVLGLVLTLSGVQPAGWVLSLVGMVLGVLGVVQAFGLRRQ